MELHQQLEAKTDEAYHRALAEVVVQDKLEHIEKDPATLISELSLPPGTYVLVMHLRNFLTHPGWFRMRLKVSLGSASESVW